MKTVIKLILIYYLLQIFGSLVAAPCVMVYEFATTGTLDVTAASTEVIIPAMLLGFVFIAIYLWKTVIWSMTVGYTLSLPTPN